MRMRGQGSVWGAVLVCLVCTLGKAHCGVFLGVAPPIVELSIPAGKEHPIELKVYNQGDSPLEVKAYVVSIEVSLDGMPVPLQTRQGKWSCAEWIELDQQTFNLEPGGQTSVEAVLKVPMGTSGGRYAAIMFEAAPDLTAQGSLNVALGTRVGTIVMESVPHTLTRGGEIDAVEVSKPDQDNVSFSTRFRNTGNVHLKARGSVVIKADDGRIVDRVPLEVGTGTVLPGAVRRFEGTWSNHRKMVQGDYVGEVRVSSTGMRTAVGTIRFRIDG
jgi:hypothetical protein